MQDCKQLITGEKDEELLEIARSEAEELIETI
jgi:hypothetical protein